jgi:hypothetical protein
MPAAADAAPVVQGELRIRAMKRVELPRELVKEASKILRMGRFAEKELRMLYRIFIMPNQGAFVIYCPQK